MAIPPPERSQHGVAYEVVVRGRLSPVLRAALVAGQPITAVEACSVLCVRDAATGTSRTWWASSRAPTSSVQEVHPCPTGAPAR